MKKILHHSKMLLTSRIETKKLPEPTDKRQKPRQQRRTAEP
ncbi:hypothetical protein [Epilithonimonas vandammei]|nr:hypothetical protein [Epilithonimonas vandammei]